MRNVTISGGQTGIRATGDTRVSIVHTRVTGSREGVTLEGNAAAHLFATTVATCAVRELNASSPNVALDACVLFPGRIRWQGTDCPPNALDALVQSTDQLRDILLAEPVPRADNSAMLAQPTIQSGSRELLPGPTNEPDLPHLRASEAPAPVGADRLVFDFESANPWCRVYPVPEKTRAGKPVVAQAVLSTDQARSGKSSVHLNAILPAGRAGRWTLKLFSIKFVSIRRPVRSMGFAMHATEANQGMLFRPRIRDASGECFYGPSRTIDWTGWKAFDWNLAESPPEPISAGDGNHTQNSPPMEVVLEITTTTDDAGGTVDLFLDDLSVDMVAAD